MRCLGRSGERRGVRGLLAFEVVQFCSVVRKGGSTCEVDSWSDVKGRRISCGSDWLSLIGSATRVTLFRQQHSTIVSIAPAPPHTHSPRTHLCCDRPCPPLPFAAHARPDLSTPVTLPRKQRSHHIWPCPSRPCPSTNTHPTHAPVTLSGQQRSTIIGLAARCPHRLFKPRPHHHVLLLYLHA